MKKLLAGAATAFAVAAMSTTASAQVTYLEYEQVSHPDHMYHIYLSESHGDSSPAFSKVTAAFTLKGKVNPDCSIFLGSGGDGVQNQTKTIDFGTIGVKTGNSESVNNAFDMVGQAEAYADSSTAGCNTNNKIEIVKDDVRGLVNAAAGGYDSDAFQAELPYTVEARWTGVDSQTGPEQGTGKMLLVGLSDPSKDILQGAWRSRMYLKFNIPVADKALVAGNYTGKTTLTLSAE